ncbi:hypothetical protein QWI17_18320 [Gilvimarinus sp. SDUM040013]|uniref:Beta-ketoacyl synthase N-terminal domain-containing protein n=1 Tax=Gilvimarinus gilvus TaxID=3058038 RepID=A0ABU4S1K0_9GAMM|nr:hypothetical protein [Gilvimarinus sp. SDUM040013]MDO3387805.1 hypothetical protein [Gilvimarinus sp. SDUM040013]MDX6851052.1 hypothetical protein [Gilvimarinus sp. SDUM040013]
MYIENSYSLLHKVDAKAPELADAQSVIQHWHGKRIRRIDRYIQLCVAGGLACTEKRELPGNTGVYLATRCGAVSTSALVMKTIEAENELPKPLHFINTLGNSAGFYLTQLLQVTGTALVLSKEAHSFEAALLHALMDLSLGKSEYALVGAFDEVALPVEHQLKRLNFAPDAPALFEGSHWLLLSNQHKALNVSLPIFANSLVEIVSVTQPAATNVQLSFAPTDAEREQLSEYQVNVFCQRELDQGVAPHGAFSAASLIDAVSKTVPMLHISRSDNGYYCAVALND